MPGGRVCALYLDARWQVIGLADIDDEAGGIAAQFAIREALLHDAQAIVVTSIKPGGPPTPEACEIAGLRELARIAKMMEISLIDHFVVTRSESVGMRQLGFI